MSTKVELQQILDIALATPEIGNVNFNILRGFLHEIIKYLGIHKKTVYVGDEGDFKTAYDLIKDGVVLLRSRTPSELDLIDEHTESPTGRGAKLMGVSPTRSTSLVKSASPVRRGSFESQEEEQIATPKRSHSATPRLSQRSIHISGDEEETEVPSDEQQATVAETSPIMSPVRSPNISKQQLDPGKSSMESRKSVEVLLGRGETIKGLVKKVSELQARIDVLENTEVPMPPMAVQSAVSVIRKESKTPAHDMKQIISVNKKLEETETSIEGLTELIDVFSAELNEIKESMPQVAGIPHMLSQIDQLNKSIEDIKAEVGKADKQEQISALENNVRELKSMLEDVKSKPEPSIDMSAVENVMDEKIKHEMNKVAQALAQRDSDGGSAAPIVVSSEPPKELKEALQKIETLVEQQATLEEQVQEIRELAEAMETKDDESEEEEAPAPAPTTKAQPAVEHQVHIPHEVVHDLKLLKKKVDSCSKDAQSTHSSLRRLDVDSKKHNTMIEDQKLQIDQLKNNLTLFQREIAEAANATRQVKPEDTPAPTPSRSRARSIVDGEDLSLVRSMIFDLQEEKDKLKQANKDMIAELYMKQKSLDELFDKMDYLHDIKADKTLLVSQVEVKADRKEVQLKVGRDDFDHYIGLVDQSLRDLLQRLEGQEDSLKQAIDGLSINVNTKLDKNEVEPLKQYLEARMKAMKPKPIEVAPPDEYAAGFRKVLIKNFHCISCDRPVDYARDGLFPPLPSAQAMPGKKSNRPYMTFELEQIRQHMLHGGMAVEQERYEIIDKQRQRIQNELLKLSGVPNIQELAEVIDRPCGGNHTLSLPHSRHIVRGLHMNKEEVTLETVEKLKNLQTVDILGQDGHIYKGLVEDMPTLPHLPQTPRKSAPRTHQSPGGPMQRSTTPASAEFIATDTIDDPGSS